MTAFTHTNLMDVEDSAVKFGYAPALESRFARGDLESEHVGVSYQRIAPDTRMPFGHHHRTQEEIYVILGGSGRAKVGDEIVELSRFDALRVAPETMRSFESGPNGLELLAFGGGDNGLQDAEVEPNWWNGDGDN
jgi:mannose-6-phosphate isomerase-like protein (cupin superfamily)